MKTIYYLFILTLFTMSACSKSNQESTASETSDSSLVKLITLDPGHFHAALIQKFNIPDIDTNVYVYAPDGPELKSHLNLINQFNTRDEDPTSWNENIYTGSDFLEKMVAEKKGNLMMTAGKNSGKVDYIKKSLEAGLNVLADKPMIVNSSQYKTLEESFAAAEKNGLLLYDIMTERFEVTTQLQKEWSQIESVFGTLAEGTPENPAVTKESVHHFFKYVAGKPLIRPAWFFDTEQQGEGIVDVTTHLVDLVQWECFPEKVLSRDNIEMVSARHWPLKLTREEFEKVTGLTEFPEYLQKDIDEEGLLNVYANGEINYKINGVHARVSVIWNYQAPEGAGDTHASIMQGTLAKLEIKQTEAENHKPVLYITPAEGNVKEPFNEAVKASLSIIQSKFPGVELEQTENGWKVIVPEKYNVGHEAHFNQVTLNYLNYLKEGKLPEWEVPNMLVKYYITTKALDMARENNN